MTARSFKDAVTINAVGMLLFQIFPMLDGGALQTACLYFSIPYWITVIGIGARRAAAITPVDYAILIGGQLLCVLGFSYFFHVL